jgi:hypothetical protein
LDGAFFSWKVLGYKQENKLPEEAPHMFKSLLKNAKLETSTTTDLTPSGEFNRLKVNVHNGRIQLRQWEQNHVQANVHIEATGGYAERLEERGTDSCWKLEQRGDEIVFEQVSQTFFGILLGGLSVNVELFVPQQHLKTRLDSHNGRVEVERFAGDVRVTTHNGAIRMEEIVGTLALESHNGDVDVEQLDGDLDVEVHNGRVEIEHVNGRVKVETHNGKIGVYECSQQLSLHTHNGAIKASTSGPLTESWDIRAGNGGIDVRIPHDNQVGFDIQSKMGKIAGDAIPLQTNAINQHLEYNIGNGGPTLKMETQMGRIEVNYVR